MSRVIARRHAAIGVAALCTAAALPRRARSDSTAMEEAARQEGSLTWYTAQLDTESAEAFGRMFTTAHPGITIEVIRTTGQVTPQITQSSTSNSFARTAATPFWPATRSGFLTEFSRCGGPGGIPVDDRRAASGSLL